MLVLGGCLGNIFLIRICLSIEGCLRMIFYVILVRIFLFEFIVWLTLVYIIDLVAKFIIYNFGF